MPFLCPPPWGYTTSYVSREARSWSLRTRQAQYWNVIQRVKGQSPSQHWMNLDLENKLLASSASHPHTAPRELSCDNEWTINYREGLYHVCQYKYGSFCVCVECGAVQSGYETPVSKEGLIHSLFMQWTTFYLVVFCERIHSVLSCASLVLVVWCVWGGFSPFSSLDGAL